MRKALIALVVCALVAVRLKAECGAASCPHDGSRSFTIAHALFYPDWSEIERGTQTCSLCGTVLSCARSYRCASGATCQARVAFEAGEYPCPIGTGCTPDGPDMQEVP